MSPPKKRDHIIALTSIHIYRVSSDIIFNNFLFNAVDPDTTPTPNKHTNIHTSTQVYPGTHWLSASCSIINNVVKFMKGVFHYVYIQLKYFHISTII